jgi:hypothetical protein
MMKMMKVFFIFKFLINKIFLKKIRIFLIKKKQDKGLYEQIIKDKGPIWEKKKIKD